MTFPFGQSAYCRHSVYVGWVNDWTPCAYPGAPVQTVSCVRSTSLDFQVSTMDGFIWLRLSQWPDSNLREARSQKCKLSAWTTRPQLACTTKDHPTLWSLFSLSLCPQGPCRRDKQLSSTRFNSLMLGHKQETINYESGAAVSVQSFYGDLFGRELAPSGHISLTALAKQQPTEGWRF